MSCAVASPNSASGGGRGRRKSQAERPSRHCRHHGSASTASSHVRTCRSDLTHPLIRPHTCLDMLNSQRSFNLSVFFVLLALAGSVPVRAADGKKSGPEIYQAKCAACHGPQGEGTSKHKRRLEGGKSVSQLAELIGQTMPEDDPGSLATDEASAVAAYVHDAFYSPIARERNRPARVELARLTVRQYRLAVADLVGSFRPRIMRGGERGL